MRHRDVADHREVIRVRPGANLKGQSATTRMRLQSSRATLSLEERPQVYTESAQVPLIDEALSCAAKSISLNGIAQMLHSGDSNFAGIYYRAEDSQRTVRRIELEGIGIHAVYRRQ